MRDYEAFLVDLRAADLIVKVGPLGCRIDDTPMNTDAERTQQYFSVMNFRDRTHWMSLMRISKPVRGPAPKPTAGCIAAGPTPSSCAGTTQTPERKEHDQDRKYSALGPQLFRRPGRIGADGLY